MHEARRAAETEVGFLAGGGEMGARMREMDWPATPLGPTARWPQSLRTAVRIMLTSRQPMFVWWGEDLVNLYNDAYKTIVGGKHPLALGQPAAQVWREIWDQVGPRAESAILANEGTYDEALRLIMERNGYPEETYYTFSYSPVPNDQGGTGGILCANTDDTQRILGERQLALLRELASRTADARTFEDACERSVSCLATNPLDLPFAMIYRVEPERRRASLCGTAGVAPGHAAAPPEVALDDAALWPFAEVLRSHRPCLVADLPRRIEGLPTGAWELPPKQAVALPIAPAGATGKSGILVAGLNPYRLFDDRYRGFVDLVAGQIAASIGNAQAYEEERRRAETLAELDRVKTAFFSNVSHEFRTPLTLMLGPTEDALASESQSLSGESLRTVHRNELRLLKLVNSLLDFARIEAGRVQASYEETDLAALTADLAGAFRPAVERAGLRFELDCPPLAEPLFVDRDMWEKIVLNLLSNAVKFTFEGAIAVGLRAVGDRVELTVRDTGTGIAAADLPHIFERFYRSEGARSRTHEGSGIGLALVHELVHLHGGEVRVESAVGRGTTFVVSIPRGRAHLVAERIGAPRTHASTATGAAPFVEEALRSLAVSPAVDDAAGAAAAVPAEVGAARILVAEDNADMRDYVCRLLSPRWTVEAVADGAAALAAARRQPPDLVLTDVMMPRLDGIGLLRELRTSERTRDIPVIVLSARAGEESRVEGLRAGVDDYLVKPFYARELLARVEAQLARAELRHLEEGHGRRLASIFAHAPVAIAILRGPQHVFEVANPRYLELLANRQVLGKAIREALPEMAGQGIFELLDSVYLSGEPFVGRSLRVLLNRGAGGEPEEAFFDFVYQPLRDDAGRVQSIIVVVFEVTELARARRAAEAANRAKDEFLAMLGHELRNPLAPITTALHLMRLRGGDELQRERQIIERQLNHLTRLVDDLLDVSRITGGKIDLKRQPVELSEIVARAIELASPLLEQRRHHLHLAVPSSGVSVDGDAVRLAQVTANLLTNAAKYTEPGGDIWVSAELAGERAVLRVRDSGIGIAAEMLPRVFDFFVQDHQDLDRSQGGLGLGLSIVRSLVRMHGGEVSAASGGKGRGSTFIVELPAAVPRSGGRDADLPPAAAAPAPRRRVLVVDDNADAAELLGELLSASGYTTEIAHDGPSAIQAVGTFDPDVVLLDIGLPAMDGYEVARRLRELPSRRPLRLVAVTGYGGEGDRQRGAAAGFDAHLVKPVQWEALESLLDSFAG